MATKLDKTLMREIDLDGETYIVRIGPSGITLTLKRHRNGVEVSWAQVRDFNQPSGL